MWFTYRMLRTIRTVVYTMQITEVLTTHLYHARWKAFIFYLCTEQIVFRPLKSSPKSEPSIFRSEDDISHTAPPCSPKSMYRLADRVSTSDIDIEICTHACLSVWDGQLEGTVRQGDTGSTQAAEHCPGIVLRVYFEVRCVRRLRIRTNEI